MYEINTIGIKYLDHNTKESILFETVTLTDKHLGKLNKYYFIQAPGALASRILCADAADKTNLTTEW